MGFGPRLVDARETSWHRSTHWQNPTLAIERDLDLIVAMDRLGFHRHGSASIIRPVRAHRLPEVVIAVAAERTKHIRSWVPE